MKLILKNWFTAIQGELDNRLGRACGVFPNWRSSLIGSMKSCRRKGERLTVFCVLHQVIQTDNKQVPDPSYFTPSGDGNVTLLSPISSPRLKASSISCSTSVEREQVPSHVSYPLPALFGTRAETSVLAPSDLFSQRRQPSIRSLDEDIFLV